MTFQVEITPIAEAQIEKVYRWYRQKNSDFADRWFRGLMNSMASLQEKPKRCGLAIEHEVFTEEVRQLLYRKGKNCYRVLFALRGERVHILFVRHTSQSPLTMEDLIGDDLD